MNKIFKSFFIKIIIASTVLEIISVVLYLLLPARFFSPAAPFLVLFFFALTTGLYFFMLRSAGNTFSHFVNQFMVVTFAKLLLYIIILFVYCFLNKPDAFPFAITFFVLYLFYTVFEIMSFLNDQKKMQK